MAFSEKKIQKAFAEILRFLRSEHVEYMLVGAIALSFWGKTRATADIDFLVQLKVEDLAQLRPPDEWRLDVKWAQYNPLIRHLQRRFIVAGIILDLMVPKDAHDRESLYRKKRKRLWSHTVFVTTPEDLIIMKMKAGRPHDFDDASSVMEMQKTLDIDYIRMWCKRLALMEEFRYFFRNR